MAEEQASTTNQITEITLASTETTTTTTVPTNPNTSVEGQGGGEELHACTMCGQIGHVSRYCPDQLCELCESRGHARVDCIMCFNCGSFGHFVLDCDRLNRSDMNEPPPESSEDDGEIWDDGTFEFSDEDEDI